MIQTHNDIENKNAWNKNHVQKKTGPFFNPVVQTKLAINKPGDVYEQEADAVADKVMETRASDLSLSGEETFFRSSKDSLSFGESRGEVIQRKCAACEEEEKNMQRKESDNTATAPSPQTENYISSLSGGDALSNKEKTFFESSMGYNFSDVRIHDNSEANESARSINALALYTW